MVQKLDFLGAGIEHNLVGADRTGNHGYRRADKISLVKTVVAFAELDPAFRFGVDDDGRKPVAVGKAQPAAGSGKFFVFVFYVVVFDFFQRAVHNPDHAFMDDAAAADGAGSAGNQSVRIEGDVFAGIVFNRLADGKQVIFVKRNFSDEFQALLIVPFQNDRRFVGQFPAFDRPEGVGVGQPDGRIGGQPAEFRIIGICGFGRRQQFYVGTVRRKGLFVFFQPQVIDAESAGAERTGQRRGADFDAGVGGDGFFGR